MSVDKICALVTGAASRQSIGYAIAEALAANGNCKCLILVDKDLSALTETEKLLAGRFKDVQVHALNYDVINLSDLSNMYLETRRRVLAVNGTLDVVVNAVGASNVSDFDADSSYLLRGLVDTSLTHVLLSTKMAFELMVKAAVAQRRNCLVLNISTDVAIDPTDPFRASEAVVRSGVATMPRAMQPVFDFSVARAWDQNGDHADPAAKPGRVRICSLLYPADLPTPAGVRDQEYQRRITLSTRPEILESVFPTLAKNLTAHATSGQTTTTTATVADVAAAAKWVLEDLTLAGRVIRVGRQRNDIWAVKYQSAASVAAQSGPTLTTGDQKKRVGTASKTAAPAASSTGLLGRLRTGSGSPPDDHAPAGLASELIRLEDMELRPPKQGFKMKL